MLHNPFHISGSRDVCFHDLTRKPGICKGTSRSFNTARRRTAGLRRVETEPNNIPAAPCQFEYDTPPDPVRPTRHHDRLRFRHFASFLRIHRNPQYI